MKSVRKIQTNFAANKLIGNKSDSVEKKDKCIDKDSEPKVFKCKLSDITDKHSVISQNF